MTPKPVGAGTTWPADVEPSPQSTLALKSSSAPPPESVNVARTLPKVAPAGTLKLLPFGVRAPSWTLTTCVACALVPARSVIVTVITCAPSSAKVCEAMTTNPSPCARTVPAEVDASPHDTVAVKSDAVAPAFSSLKLATGPPNALPSSNVRASGFALSLASPTVAVPAASTVLSLRSVTDTASAKEAAWA